MKVNVIAATDNPLDVISRTAGCCYGKDDVREARVERCYDAGHMSVFEHASFTVRIDGISRACANQLVRHRLASYAQESLRYVKIDTDDDWYVVPECFEGNEAYKAFMGECARAYQLALKSGVPAEDARMMLPLATKTSIVMTVNLREFYTMLELRTAPQAQAEIRQLFRQIFNAIADISEQWRELMLLWDDIDNE